MEGKAIAPMVGFLLVTLACGVLIPPTAPDQPGVETVVAGTVEAFKTSVSPTDVPPSTEAAQRSGTPVSFQNVSLVIPNGIATGARTGMAEAQSVDDAPPFLVAPAHIVFEFTGWPKPNTNQISPSVMIFPAQEYAAINEGAANSLTLLRNILADPAAPINLQTAPPIPDLPLDQLLVAQPTRLSFANGSGIRMINFYAALPLAVTDQGQLYHFAGLTSDGEYYILAVLPLKSPLRSTSDNPAADGVIYPGPDASQEAATNYYQAVTDILDAASPDSFTPTLDQLDALIQSITVTSE